MNARLLRLLSFAFDSESAVTVTVSETPAGRSEMPRLAAPPGPTFTLTISVRLKPVASTLTV